jgi:hypothetical protein
MREKKNNKKLKAYLTKQFHEGCNKKQRAPVEPNKIKE